MNSLLFKNLDPKRKAIFSLSAYILITFCIYFFVITKTINDIKEIRGDIVSKKIDIEKNITQERNMSELSAEIKKIEPQMEKFSQIFINNNRELEFITQLENIAAKHNITQKLSLNPLNTNEEKDDTYYFEVPISIEASGLFENLTEYIKELESLTYYINIKNISIIPGGTPNLSMGLLDNSSASQNSKNVNLSLSATTYWK